MHLDLAGVAASGGSACSTGAVEPSHVLVAMGVPRELALGADPVQPGHGRARRPTSTRAAEVMPGGGGQGAASSPGCWAVRMTAARAGRDVGRRGQLGRRRPAGRAGLRRGRRHHEAVLLRRRRPRPALLLARLDQRRARRGARARDPALRPQSRGPLQPARDPELRERVQPRAGRRFPACAATRSPSSATCWPTPTRSTATTSPPATTPWRATARSTAARDRSKDQSYFLWGIDRAVVARMLTPVGELTKAETRAYARRLGLATADKPESVEICFVPDDDYVGVLERHLPADAPALAPGPAGHHRRRGDRRAPGLRPLHHRPAARACPAGSPSRATWWPSGRSAARSWSARADELGGPPGAAGGAQLAGRPARGRATRCEVQIRYRARRGPGDGRRDATARRSMLALARAGPGHHARPVRRALRPRRPGAGRRRDRVACGLTCAIPAPALAAQRRRALGGGLAAPRARLPRRPAAPARWSPRSSAS